MENKDVTTILHENESPSRRRRPPSIRQTRRQARQQRTGRGRGGRGRGVGRRLTFSNRDSDSDSEEEEEAQQPQSEQPSLDFGDISSIGNDDSSDDETKEEEEEYDVTVGARMGKGMDTPLIKPTPNLKF